MPQFKVDAGRSKLTVSARSSIHDTNTEWTSIKGTVDADATTLVEAGATASFEVDMSDFDAGDWLKNRKLKKDMDVGRHPTATFNLTELRDVTKKEDGSFEATAIGKLDWRGRSVTLTIAGKGSIDDDGVDASGTFELDIRDLGMKPPKVLMFKVEPVVAVEVTLRAVK